MTDPSAGQIDPSATASLSDADLPPLPREVPPFYAGVVIWGRSGDLLLQQRDNIPGISSPGMISTFGGGGEEGETAIQCAVREIREETNLEIDPEHILPLLKREKRFKGPTIIPIYTFGVMDVAEDGLHVTEGSLFRLAPGDLDGTGNMTESCRESCQVLIDRFG